jgi:hypothetical protein
MVPSRVWLRVLGLVSFVLAAGGTALAAPRSLILEQSVPGTIVDVDATRILWYPSLADPVLRMRPRGGTTDTVLTGSSMTGYLTTFGAIWSTGEYKNGAFLPTVPARGLKARGSYATWSNATGLWHRNLDTSTDTLIRAAPLTFPFYAGTTSTVTVTSFEIADNGDVVYETEHCDSSCASAGARSAVSARDRTTNVGLKATS